MNHHFIKITFLQGPIPCCESWSPPQQAHAWGVNKEVSSKETCKNGAIIVFVLRLFVLEGLRHRQVLGSISALRGQPQGEGKKKEKTVCPSSFRWQPGLVPPSTAKVWQARRLEKKTLVPPCVWGDPWARHPPAISPCKLMAPCSRSRSVHGRASRRAQRLGLSSREPTG